MVFIDCDFHIHSKYSAATSKDMELGAIAENAKLKGLDIIGTGDALHKLWLEDIEELDFKEGVGRIEGEKKTGFVLTTEVEDKNRVHHLILFPELKAVYGIKEEFQKFSKDLDIDGRPHLSIGGEEIAKICHKFKALIGPSHAFVPWTSIYKEFDSIKECYGKEKIDFLELGLSADTEMADKIEELEGIAFLSNSDAHSPLPNRLGREFNRLKVEAVTFEEIAKAIHGIDSRGIILNVGFDPRLGKYHRTSCIKCFKKYSLEEAVALKWRCKNCKGILKKGVKERADELARVHEKSEAAVSKKHKRPQYIRIAPLAEIMAQALNVASVYSPKIRGAWEKLVKNFGSEIKVLLDAEIEEIKTIDQKIAEYIEMYRNENFTIEEGGGGQYGRIIFKNREKREENIAEKKDQKSEKSKITTLDNF